MKKIIHCLIVTLFSFAAINCSNFSVKRDFEKTSEITALKKIGLVLRLSIGSKISKEEQEKNLVTWIGVHENVENVSVITETSNDLSIYNTINDRFFQSTIKYRKESYFALLWEDNYLKYKSLGTLNNYLRKNENELKDIITRHSLDGLVIYEIYNIVSVGMQFMDFETVVAMIDKNLNIIYMDHQSDRYEISEQIFERAKQQLTNKISERLVEELIDLDFISEISEE